MPSKVKTGAATKKLPVSWPDDVTYLVDHTYSASVTLELLVKLHTESAQSASLARIPVSSLKAPCLLVEVRTITDAEHPANGQRGLFANQHLPPDTFILPYMGHVHTNSMSDTDPHSDFDLSLDRELGLSVDAAHSGNEARFANDYRGIKDRANAEFRDCFVEVSNAADAGGKVTTRLERRTGIFVLSAGKAGLRKGGIKAGEEILLSYGRSFWESRKTMASFRKDEDMLRIANAALNA